MGVPGLWEIVSPAATVESHTHLAVTQGFISSTKFRGLRVGIDASIWLFHSNWGVEGENPELRTLFFRCCRLLQAPFLPVFVFDGPLRPAQKRGKRINTAKDHALTQGMIQIIKAFGFEFWHAPGEAEAELAWLNKIDAIDAILTDDSDTLVFGGLTIIRNTSNTLSGNKSKPALNANGKDDKQHAKVFRLSSIKEHAEIGLDTPDMIFLAVCMGGDYDQSGIHGCGPKIAFGLAKAGFGRTLCQAASNRTREQLVEFLHGWRTDLKHELTTNTSKCLPNKSPKLARSIDDASFPSLDVLYSYLDPITSGSRGMVASEVRAKLCWAKEPDLGKLAHICELKFEWGYRDRIIYRFRTILWEGAVMRIMRRAVLEHELVSSSRELRHSPPSTPARSNALPSAPLAMAATPGTPSQMIARHFSNVTLQTPHTTIAMGSSESSLLRDSESLFRRIHSTRNHVSTDGLLEYRVEIDPTILVNITHAGIQDIRPPMEINQWATTAAGSDEEDFDDRDEGDSDAAGAGKKKTKTSSSTKKKESTDTLRIWLPACIVEMVRADMVEEYHQKKAGRGKKKTKNTPATAYRKGSSSATTSKSTGTRRRGKYIPREEEEEDLTSQLAVPLDDDVDLSQSTGAPPVLPTHNQDSDRGASPCVVRDLTKNRPRTKPSEGPSSVISYAHPPAQRKSNSSLPKEVDPSTTSSTSRKRTTTTSTLSSRSKSLDHASPTSSRTSPIPSFPPSSDKDWLAAHREFQNHEEEEESSEEDLPIPSRLFLRNVDEGKKAATRTDSVAYIELSDSDDGNLRSRPTEATTTTRTGAPLNKTNSGTSKRGHGSVSSSSSMTAKIRTASNPLTKSSRRNKSQKSPRLDRLEKAAPETNAGPRSPTLRATKAKDTADRKPSYVELSSSSCSSDEEEGNYTKAPSTIGQPRNRKPNLIQGVVIDLT